MAVFRTGKSTLGAADTLDVGVVYQGDQPAYGVSLYASFQFTGPNVLTPTGLTATATLPQTIVLAWTASPGDVTYSLERSTDNLTWAVIPGCSNLSTTSFTDQYLNLAATYFYRVKGINAYSQVSPPSAVASATTKTAPMSVSMAWSTSFKVPVGNTPSAGFLYFYENVGLAPPGIIGTGGGGVRVNQRSDGVNNQAPQITTNGSSIKQQARA